MRKLIQRSIIAIMAIAMIVIAYPKISQYWNEDFISDAEAKWSLLNIASYSYSQAGGGEDYSDIFHWWAAEEETPAGDGWNESTDCSEDDTSPALLGTYEVTDTRSAFVGSSYSGEAQDQYDFVEFALTGHDMGSLVLGSWIYFDVLSNGDDVINIQDGTYTIEIRMGGAEGSLIVYDPSGEGTICSGGSGWTLDNWSFLEVILDETNHKRILMSDGVEICSDLVTEFSYGTITTVELGTISGSNYPVGVDNMMCSSDAATPRDFCGLNAGNCEGLAVAITHPSGACGE